MVAVADTSGTTRSTPPVAFGDSPLSEGADLQGTSPFREGGGPERAGGSTPCCVRTPKWCAVALSEVRSRGFRLEASVYDVDARAAREHVISSRHGFVRMMGAPDSPVANAFYGSRGKRNYVSRCTPDAIGFLGSSAMLDCFPEPDKFIPNSAAESFRITPQMVLISRSGTIGNLTFANKTLSRFLVSEHAIRLECRDYSGFIYAFLKSKDGQSLVKSCVFGSVIQEIEPEHLAALPVPNAPNEVKRRIHEAVVKSYALRDESNELLAQAQKLLTDGLNLPGRGLQARDAAGEPPATTAPYTFTIRLSNLDGRLDCSYHLPIVRTIISHLRERAAEVATVGDRRISEKIILPGRFARVYVEEGYGRVMIGGKQLGEIDPSNKKYLSQSKHKKEIDALATHEGTILVTRSGTIGRVALTPRHWDGWVPSDHILRVVPSSPAICGYLYVWLSSEWAKPLIVRNAYGAVIDEISDIQLASVPVPLLRDAAVQTEINHLALAASSLRSEAYDLEQSALKMMDQVLSLG